MRRYPQEEYMRVLLEGIKREVYSAYERSMASCLPHLGGDIDCVFVVNKEIDTCKISSMG